MKNSHYKWSGAERTPIRICFTDSPMPMKPHAQGELELMYFFVTEGCKYKCNGRELTREAGQLAAVHPGELHSCNDWGAGCRAVCIIIDLQKLTLPSLLKRRFDNVISDRQIENTINRIYALLQDDSDPAALDCLVLGCICELLAILLKYSKIPSSKSIGRKNELELVKSYVLKNLSASLRVGELAAAVHLSEDRFYHVFKDAFGISPSEYILETRIWQACNLLAYSERSITEIAQECGFCTASYFSAQFRRIMRISPLQYRRQSHTSDDLASDYSFKN